jgi:hypothetical protein
MRDVKEGLAELYCAAVSLSFFLQRPASVSHFSAMHWLVGYTVATCSGLGQAKLCPVGAASNHGTTYVDEVIALGSKTVKKRGVATFCTFFGSAVAGFRGCNGQLSTRRVHVSASSVGSGRAQRAGGRLFPCQFFNGDL